MGYINGFMLNADTPAYVTFGDPYTFDLFSARQLEKWMYWMDSVAINNNILSGSKFTWLRQLGTGAATSFTPQNTAPFNLGGTFFSNQVFAQIVSNIKTLGTHFGWDFADYPPANMYGRKITYSGSTPIYSFDRTVPGFAGATASEDYVGVGHQWPPSAVHDYGAPVRSYSDTQFPHPTLTQDYYEGYPFIYGPFPGYGATPAQQIKTTIQDNPGSGWSDWEIYSYNIEKDVTVCNSTGPYSSGFSSAYSSTSMLNAMSQAFSSFQSTAWTVTETSSFSGVPYYAAEASAHWVTNDPAVPDYNLEYYANIHYITQVNIFCIRNKKIVEIFGADTTSSRGASGLGRETSGGTNSTFSYEKGAWATINDSLGSYYTKDLNGYTIASQANRISIITGLLSSLFNATFNNFNPAYTVSAMVNDNSGHLLFDMTNGIPAPSSNPFPSTATKIQDSTGVQNSCVWGGNYSGPTPSAADYWYGKERGLLSGGGVTENLWLQDLPSGIYRWASLEPHLYDFTL
jgi:hypothetical protein